MNTPEPVDAGRVGVRGRLLPLYAAGFVTAFGAHSIAASLGGYTHGQHASLLALGVLLAVYDGAEVLLKPVFGSLPDRSCSADYSPSPPLPRRSSSPAIPRGLGWPGSGRAPRRPRSPRRPGYW